MSTPEQAIRAGLERLAAVRAAQRKLAEELAVERRREEERQGLTVPAGTPELEQKEG